MGSLDFFMLRDLIFVLNKKDKKKINFFKYLECLFIVFGFGDDMGMFVEILIEIVVLEF